MQMSRLRRHGPPRLLVAALGAGLLVLAVAAPVSAAAPSAEPQRQLVTHTLKPAKLKGKLTALHVASGREVSATDAPLGGCNWGNLGGYVDSLYVDGQLAWTDSNYWTNVTCTATAPDQTMAHLWDMAQMNRGSGSFATGPIVTCYYPNIELTPCLSVTSAAPTATCIGVGCAGNYWIDHEPFLQLPPGWVWASLPSDCTLLDPQTITCTYASEPVYIPPTV
jgi:hypothetical protein